MILKAQWCQMVMLRSVQRHTGLTRLFRPPDIVVGGLIFYRDSSSLFFLFSPPNLRARWAELNQNRPHARKWLQFENACPKSGVSPPPKNLGPKNHLFGPTSQLNGNFIGLYLQNETRYRQSVKCVDNYKGSPTSSQNVMNFGPQTA